MWDCNESVNLSRDDVDSTSLFSIVFLAGSVYECTTNSLFVLHILLNTTHSNETMNQPQGKLLVECFTQPSLPSITQCIKSDFLLKYQTNFYIPQEALGGYSYLHRPLHPANTHGHYWFVMAEEPSGLHPHHPWHTNSNPTSFLSHDISKSPIFSTNHTQSTQSIHPMTIPYIHPEMQLPVPPLQLPTYFGVLCFSFTVGGIMLLYWTPRWTRNHWFPYRFFAWALILLQVRTYLGWLLFYCNKVGPSELIVSFYICVTGTMLLPSRLCSHDQQFTLALD
jgi:hypothetical protein